MSTGNDPTGQGPSEEELRAAYEAELKKIRVEHVLLEQVVTMIYLGLRRTGLAPGTETEKDPGQVRLAIEGVRALLPLIEQVAPAQGTPIRDALSQLQMAYVRIGGQPSDSEPAAPPESPPPGAGQPGPAAGQPGPAAGQPGAPGEPSGPAQRSGRLWVPGQ